MTTPIGENKSKTQDQTTSQPETNTNPWLGRMFTGSSVAGSVMGYFGGPALLDQGIRYIVKKVLIDQVGKTIATTIASTVSPALVAQLGGTASVIAGAGCSLAIFSVSLTAYGTVQIVYKIVKHASNQSEKDAESGDETALDVSCETQTCEIELDEVPLAAQDPVVAESTLPIEDTIMSKPEEQPKSP